MVSKFVPPCFIFVILAISVPGLIANQTDLSGPTPPTYHISVTPLTPQVESGQKFAVMLRVTNSSPVPQSFVAMSCSWLENWQARPSEQSNGNHVSLGEGYACAANAPQTITLKPGEFHEWQTVMFAWSDKKQHKSKVNFQVGFTTSPPGGFTSPKGNIPIYWSDDAGVEIVK